MTEKGFWEFLNGMLEQGRVEQVCGVIDSDEPRLQQTGRFLGGHALLPANYEQISKGNILEMGELLVNGDISIRTKEAILIILAHIPSRDALNILKKYNKRPDVEVKFFSELALNECEMWNE